MPKLVVDMPLYRYRNINQLKQDLAQFHDIEFDYHGRSYAICPIDDLFVAGNAGDVVDESGEDFFLS